MGRDAEKDTLKQLKRAMEFYQGIGFEHYPMTKDNLDRLLSPLLSDKGSYHSGEIRSTGESSIVSSEKKDQLKKLKADIGDCQRCRLSHGRKHIVFGEGNPQAKLMFVGEGPGREEDIQGRPFVGDAGKVLTNLIKKMGLRREDVYIANIVKCRPPNNRDPEEEEKAACGLFLEKQIDIIQPKIIMALGRIAAHTLTGSSIPITKLRGSFFQYKGIPVMPTFHPAYLMRNPKDKWLTWEDAQKVLERLK
jgi:DNA polymerase